MNASTPAPPPSADKPSTPPPAAAGPPRGAPVLVRAYAGTSFAWLGAIKLLHAIFEGAWLGLLRRDDLYAVDERFYNRNAQYLGDEHNLRGLMPWEEAALAEGFGGCRRLLLLGAGGGREVLALSRLGYDVTGYECNRALVEVAARILPAHGCHAPVHHLPRDAAPPAAGEPYDGIILGWGSYTLIPGRAHRVSLLRRLRPLAREGGPILLSVHSRPGDSARVRIATGVANAVRTVLLRRERVEPGDGLTTNFVHYFTEQEIAGELRDAGWEPRCYTPHGTGGRDSGWAIGIARGAEDDARLPQPPG